MSMHVNQYVIYGVRLDFEKYESNYDDWEEYMSSAFDDVINVKDDMTIIFDGYNGKYIYIGHCLRKTDDYEYMPIFSFDELCDELDSGTKDEILNKVKNLLNGENVDLSFYFVTDYS